MDLERWTKSADETAFYVAISEDPYDATTRLVFADWLQENGRTEDEAYQRNVATTLPTIIPSATEAVRVRLMTWFETVVPYPYEFEPRHMARQTILSSMNLHESDPLVTRLVDDALAAQGEFETDYTSELEITNEEIYQIANDSGAYVQRTHYAPNFPEMCFLGIRGSYAQVGAAMVMLYELFNGDRG